MTGHAFLAAQFFIKGEGLFVPVLGGVQVAPGLGEDAEVAVLTGHAFLAAQLFLKGEGLFVPVLGGVQVAPGSGEDAEVA